MPGPRARAPFVGGLLASLILAGCVGDSPQPTALANPKVLVDRADGDLTQVYVHGAFAERSYDRVVVRVDNETVAADTDVYAVVVKLDAVAFDLHVDAQEGATNWTARALVRIVEDGAEVALHDADADAFADFRETDLPWQKILEPLASREESP